MEFGRREDAFVLLRLHFGSFKNNTQFLSFPVCSFFLHRDSLEAPPFFTVRLHLSTPVFNLEASERLREQRVTSGRSEVRRVAANTTRNIAFRDERFRDNNNHPISASQTSSSLDAYSPATTYDVKVMHCQSATSIAYSPSEICFTSRFQHCSTTWTPAKLLLPFDASGHLYSLISADDTVIKFDDRNGFQKFEKIKNSSRQSRQPEELIGKMRECKRLIKEFDREVKDLKHTVKELNSYVALKKHNIENKRVDLFGGPVEGFEEDNGLLASSMTNQQLMDNCHHMMDETDQAIECSEKVVHETVTVGTETAATLKAQVASLLHDDVLDDVDTRFYACSHLFWVDDQDGIKDGERVLLCLKRALRIANPAQQMANVARGSSEPVTLFDEILNKFMKGINWKRATGSSCPPTATPSSLSRRLSLRLECTPAWVCSGETERAPVKKPNVFSKVRRLFMFFRRSQRVPATSLILSGR
ncbi:hypothetical protein LXL04_026235 [Taraxacum kok-saghyz]